MTAEPLSESDVKARVQRLLPGVMLGLMHESLAAAGVEIRQDVRTFVERSITAGLEGMDMFMQNRVANKTADEATELLKAPNADTLQANYACVARAMLKIGNEGVMLDSNALTVCAMVEAEQLDFPGCYGPSWEIDRGASRLENMARLRGWFLAAPVPVA